MVSRSAFVRSSGRRSATAAPPVASTAQSEPTPPRWVPLTASPNQTPAITRPELETRPSRP
jgi:hypothetical protein